MGLSVMLVEDDALLAKMIERHLERHKIAIRHAQTIAEAEAALAEGRYHAALIDVGLPDGRGFDVLERVPSDQRPAVIFMTGEATFDAAVGALRQGAIDFLHKPFSMDALDAALARVMTVPRTRVAVPVERDAVSGWRRRHAPEIVGEHPSLLRVFDILSRVADTDCSILIQGETGTGKELIAKAIHSSSGRGGKAFVAVNCAAMPEQLMESELFGHARGAFTGATNARIGRFAAADGGTLFLDEIGEMPLAVQAKLLRALQEKEITPVGETRGIKVDARIVAATHRTLEEMVAARQFREDLLYRLDVLRVELPPLRARESDIPLLVREFVRVANEKRKRSIEGIDDDALNVLVAYSWPGNVRQLQNIVERMVLLRGTGTLLLEDIPPGIREQSGGRAHSPVVSSSANGAHSAAAEVSPFTRPQLPTDGIDLRDAVERFENALIEQALERASGNRSRAAQILKMNRTTLVEKLRKRGLNDDNGSSD